MYDGHVINKENWPNSKVKVQKPTGAKSGNTKFERVSRKARNSNGNGYNHRTGNSQVITPIV